MPEVLLSEDESSEDQPKQRIFDGETGIQPTQVVSGMYDLMQQSFIDMK